MYLQWSLPPPDWQQFAVKWLIFEIYLQHHVKEHKILYQKLEKTKIGPGPPSLALSTHLDIDTSGALRYFKLIQQVLSHDNRQDLRINGFVF